MGRRVIALTGETIEELPDPCRSCLFWELGHPRPDLRSLDGRRDELAGDPRVQKSAWCASRVIDGTPPGRVVRVEDELTGYVLFGGPDVFAPRKPPAPPLSDDALLLATVWIQPHWRGLGIGRLLIQAAIKEALRLDLSAVEVYGDRRFREHDCVLPTTWLLHEGFEVHREHPRYPVLRLDARRTVRWAETFEQALEELLERLPRHMPSPVPSPIPEGVPRSRSVRRSAGPPGD